MSVTLIVQLLAWLVALLWTGKAVEAYFGLRRVTNLLLPEFDLSPAGEPRVTVLVPARDEAANIRVCLMSLLGQDYGNLNILAIDDRSNDATGSIMDELAESHETLSVLHITELPDGWLGKTHAMAMAARQVIAEQRPDYLLFTDADVIFHPEAIRRGLAQAVATQADHFVLAPTPILKTAGEAALLSFLQMMGVWAARPWRVSDPMAKRDAIGIGAFNLLKTESYLALGGFDVLRMQILEDLTLARRVKTLGMRQRIAFAPGMVSLHWAAGAMGVVKVMTKNLFAIFGFRSPMLLGACLMFILLCLEPFVGLVTPGMRLQAVLALGGIVGLYWVARKMGRMPAWTALAFPFSACLFVFSMLRSMVVTLRDGGVTWRGTFYSLKELRATVESLR